MRCDVIRCKTQEQMRGSRAEAVDRAVVQSAVVAQSNDWLAEQGRRADATASRLAVISAPRLSGRRRANRQTTSDTPASTSRQKASELVVNDTPRRQTDWEQCGVGCEQQFSADAKAWANGLLMRQVETMQQAESRKQAESCIRRRMQQRRRELRQDGKGRVGQNRSWKFRGRRGTGLDLCSSPARALRYLSTKTHQAPVV